MCDYTDYAAYEKILMQRAKLPKGFLAGSVPLSFFLKEKETTEPYRMNLSVILLNEPTIAFAGVFTRNMAPGAPVVIGKELLNAPSSRGVIINNKIANVCAPGGKSAAMAVVEAFRQAAGWDKTGDDHGAVFPSSTGVIGWGLPVPEMKSAAEQLADLLCSTNGKDGPIPDSIFPVAKGIMTTDAFPKIREVECESGRIVAVAKGAGMIEPNMATMLVFITTDIDVSRAFIRDVLPRVTEKTFNLISIDGDQSTSDTVLIFSSRLIKGIEESVFEEALFDLCRDLAEDIVRNGEGTNHVVKVRIGGSESISSAKGFGKAVVNSPLVKTAIYGNDPNIGRIIMALGDYAGNEGEPFNTDVTTISIGGVPVFRNGSFLLSVETETKLKSYLSKCALGNERKNFPAHEKTVDIEIDLNMGDYEVEILGSDLSYEYVRENADYRT